MTRPAGPPVDFALLETMRLEGGVVHRLARHLARMRASAGYFGFAWDETAVERAVAAAAATHREGCWRLRLTVDSHGAPQVECSPHRDEAGRVWRVALASQPVDRADPFLIHKTTWRATYESARRERPDRDDVLLWNETGELTESTIANLVLELDGRRVTPPVASGLLPGILRTELVERGELVERILNTGDLARAPRVWLVNSLRGFVEATVE